jgi:hypothetical protein
MYLSYSDKMGACLVSDALELISRQAECSNGPEDPNPYEERFLLNLEKDLGMFLDMYKKTYGVK